jgi:hypothetical protein
MRRSKEENEKIEKRRTMLRKMINNRLNEISKNIEEVNSQEKLNKICNDVDDNTNHYWGFEFEYVNDNKWF